MADGNITRRGAALALASGLLKAQQVPYRDYSRVLPDYIRRLAGVHYAARERALAKLTTPAAIEARKQWARKTFWDLIGGEPQRTPLNVRSTGGFERPGYKVEHLTYESQPGLFIPANFYIPKNSRPPHPGVLFQLGHSLNGKAAAPYQKCCQGLAQLGFAVLAFDTMGQGERTYYPRANGVLTRLNSADAEHTVPGQQLLLTGDSSTRLQTWDAVRSLDVLASHPLVDPKRLASTGNSGGGTLTMFLACVDDRLAAAAPSCPNSENFVCADFVAPGSTDDAEQNFPNAAPLGFDRWDTLYPFAPKPLLIVVSAKDFFGTYSPSYIASGRVEMQRLKAAYAALGKGALLRWTESPLSHGLHHANRMEIYDWLKRHLQGANSPVVEEPPVAPEKDETLWATKDGSVIRSLGGIRPIDIAKRRADSITRKPADIKALLQFEEPKPQLSKLAQTTGEGCTIDAIEVTSAANVFLPCWLIQPKTPASGDPLILLDPAGRNARAGEDALGQQLARAGRTVCLPDLRGIGDLNPSPSQGSARYTVPHTSEHDYAWASAVLGRSLLGQRVTDLIAVVRALDAPRVSVAALGKMTVPAIFAAAIEPRIARLYLAGGLRSYRDLLDQEEYREPFANFLPHVLQFNMDLPDLIRGIAPRVVTQAAVSDWTVEKIVAAAL